MTENDDDFAEYTRFKAKVQIGDGPDQRGEVTVETVRELDEERQGSVDGVELPNGETVDYVPSNNREFAEFFHELTRGEGALRQTLGLETEDEE